MSSLFNFLLFFSRLCCLVFIFFLVVFLFSSSFKCIPLQFHCCHCHHHPCLSSVFFFFLILCILYSMTQALNCVSSSSFGTSSGLSFSSVIGYHYYHCFLFLSLCIAFTSNVTFNPFTVVVVFFNFLFPKYFFSFSIHFTFDNLLQQVHFPLPSSACCCYWPSFTCSFSAFCPHSPSWHAHHLSLTKVSHLCASCAVNRTVTVCEAVALFVAFCIMH